MKFACVEFTTKSGRIWSHTDARPNYLADHQREIDATSYGTWTSALRGEHIPVTWFMDGKNGPGVGQKFGLWRRLRAKWNLRKGEPLVEFKNLSYLDDIDVTLVCFHSYGYRWMADFMEAARAAHPNKIFIGTNSVLGFDITRQSWRDPDWYRRFREFLDNIDIFIVANPETVEYFQLMTDTPVVYFPQFYPVAYANKYRTKLDQKEKIIFVAGDTQRRDMMWSCHIARKIQQSHPDFEIHIIGSATFNYEALSGADYKILDRFTWEEYLEVTSRARIIINTDVEWTNGRVQADAAMVGTPCIGSNAGRQTELFPELSCSDVSDSARAIKLADQLITDRRFYETVAQDAYDRLDRWSYKNGAVQLSELIQKYSLGKIE